jgi:hypothetical protein
MTQTKQLPICEEDKNEIECNDIVGDVTGTEGIDWYRCPDLIYEIREHVKDAGKRF